MSQFVQRLANYLANEVLIKGLANSKTFQRFAVRTNKQYEDFAKEGTEHLNKTLDEMAQQQAGAAVKQQAGAAASAAKETLTPPKPPLRGIPGFFVAFGKEVRRDIAGQ